MPWFVAVAGGLCHAFQQQHRSRSSPMIMMMATASSSSSSTTDEEIPNVTVAATDYDPEEEARFKEEIRILCQERNLRLQKVKNCRDLAASPKAAEKIKSGRIFRTGRLGDATAQDREVLFEEPPTGLGLRTLVDLRSPTELKDDKSLMDSEVFDAFTDLVWIENGRGRDGCLRELQKGVSPIDKARKRKSKVMSSSSSKSSSLDELETVAICEMGCEEPDAISAAQVLATQGRKERHFVSLMNEFKYVRGTVTKLRKRDIAKAIMKAPGAFLSKRIWNSLKKPFITEINAGGLIMLNELLLRFGAPGIKYVLDLCSEREKHPIAFYCTAGKDRTGMIAAIILSLCGVEPEDIVEDYALSANVYAEMNDHQAMVGALSQRSLDPKTFLGAPPEVMADTLLSIEENYGSVEGYCDYIGFGPERREKLRKALTED